MEALLKVKGLGSWEVGVECLMFLLSKVMVYYPIVVELVPYLQHE